MRYQWIGALSVWLAGTALAMAQPAPEFRPAVGFYHPMAPAIYIPPMPPPGPVYTESMYQPGMDYAPVPYPQPVYAMPVYPMPMMRGPVLPVQLVGPLPAAKSRAASWGVASRGVSFSPSEEGQAETDPAGLNTDKKKFPWPWNKKQEVQIESAPVSAEPVKQKLVPRLAGELLHKLKRDR